MKDYKRRPPEVKGIQRRRDGAWIPDDPRNRDWQKYLKWVEQGNQPDPHSRRND